jgi:hypothetical protein
MVTDWTWGREFGRVVVVVLAERAETKPGWLPVPSLKKWSLSAKKHVINRISE